MPLRLENICRTCMYKDAGEDENFETSKGEPKINKSQMVSLKTIYKDIQEDASLMVVLKATAPQLTIESNDKLPKNICQQCVAKVKELHEFQRNCLKVQQQLYKMLEVSNDGQLSYDVDSNECDNQAKSEIDDVFIDENSFQSDEFIDEEDAKDFLVAVSDIEDFIESCSDMSIDFVLDDDSDSDFNVSQSNKANKSKSLNQDVSARDLFACEKCNKMLKSKKSLKKHLEMHNRKDTEERKCVCNICDRAFSHAYMLREHLRSHSGEKPFLCSECGKSFTTSSSLKQHLLRHQSEKQFACPDCPKTFPTRTDLSSHYAVHKARPKIHICDVCGRGFPKAFILKTHKMTHTSERPYPCEFCDKRFLTNEKLQRHTRIHTGEKPYKCKYCDRAYCQSNELTKHLRCHLGDNVYQCRLCPERYPTAKMVKEHFTAHKHDDEQTRAQHLANLNAMEIKGIFCR